MKLYNSLGPNPHTVRMFAAEKGITLPLQEVDVMGSEHRRSPYGDKINVMQQTPAFETDDGQIICEVTAICEYLEELKPEPRLIGATPGERAETRMRSEEHTPELQSLMRISYAVFCLKKKKHKISKQKLHCN